MVGSLCAGQGARQAVRGGDGWEVGVMEVPPPGDLMRRVSALDGAFPELAVAQRAGLVAGRIERAEQG